MRFFVLTYLLTFLLTSFAQSTLPEVIQMFEKHQFTKLRRSFAPEFKNQVSKRQLKYGWVMSENRFGAYQNYFQHTKSDANGAMVEQAYLRFEQGGLKIQLSMDGDKISLLRLTPLSYTLPAYGKELPYFKRNLMVHSDTFELPGEYIAPASCDSCPLVVLVHGSGPSDMDETVGANKVFYDLALGLAKQGIASFRYEKRSQRYPAYFKGQFTLFDETIDDAVSAVRAIQEDTSIKYSKLIVLGHSLGAYSAPLIADSLKELDGVILFSSNARNLEDLIIYQMEYLSNLDSSVNKVENKVIEMAKERASIIKEGKYTQQTSAAELLAYWPGTFWASIANYDPVEKVKSLEQNVLILQGEMDYQITMVDFGIWEMALPSADYPNVTCKSFPGLTHLFTPSTLDQPSPMEYFIPANVDYGVITYISDWVKNIP